MAEVGYRVIRGPDWPLQDEDGGDGCAGTVVEVGGKGKSTLPKNLVFVQWDMGKRLDHRAGYYGDYDLYVVDTAAVGIKHDGVQCNNCCQKPVQGMRWCCLDCSNNYNLCTSCYMFDEHDKAHEFKRIDKPGASGTSVGKRRGTEKMQKRGIFKGSKVMRGADWRWDDQDGGAGKDGVVLEIEDWKPEFPKTSVKVSWAHAGKENYRVGYKGKVDLKCLIPGIGGLIYKSHLPMLGEDIPPKQKIEVRANKSPAKKTEENRKIEEEDLKSFNSTEGIKMKKRNKKVNEKDRQLPQKDKPKNVTEKKDGKSERPAGSITVVQKNGRNIKRDEVKETAERRKKAVEAVRHQNQESRSNGKLQTGDNVRILEDKEIVRKLQIGHGHWNDEISKCVGQLAQVLQIDGDGDVEVLLKTNGNSKKLITFNPAALRLETSSKLKEANTIDNRVPPTKDSTPEVTSYVSTFAPTVVPGMSLEELSYGVEVSNDTHLPTKEEKESAVIFVGSAGQGNLAIVKKLLDRYPNIIDVKVQGQTALHQACHNGRMDIVDFLLKNKASLTIKDQQYYTALHHSAYGDKEGNTAGLVIFSGANINENGNPQQSSPLHLAVMRCNLNVVQVLVKAGCDLTLKDMAGDTPLHDALRVGEYNIVEAILSSKRDSVMFVCNKQGANPMIQAVCSRYTPAAKKMVETFPQAINAIDKHGMTVLHYAAVYEDKELTECILNQGENCNLEVRNKNRQNALDLAVAAESSVKELLLSRNKGTSQNDNTGAALKLAFRNRALPIKIKKSYTYHIGDMVHVRSAWTVVAALAHYHGEWTSGMKSAVDRTGEIRDIHDDNGDLDVLMENGLHFRFNSLAVTMLEASTDESATKTKTCTQMSQDLQMMPYYGIPEMLPESVDSSLSDNEDTLGSALFQSIGMRMTWRVTEILEQNPNLANHVENGLPVLNQAARDGNVEVMKELLMYGARVNEKQPDTGTTALFDAAISDTSGEAVKLLLQQEGCDPNQQQCTSGHTPLHVAVLRGNIAAVRALVDGGSNLNVQNVQGDTVYHEAAKKERVEMLKILLENQNVDLCNLFNGTGLNVIHIAAYTGNASIVRMMLEQSPDLVTLFTMDDNHATPLHVACLKGHLEVVNALLNTGLCDLYAEDADGRTALAFASNSNNEQLISLRLIEEYENKEHGDETARKDSAVTHTEKPHFAIDDVVKVRSNLELLVTLQKTHGGFTDNMVEALNKQGQVLSIDEDGDIEVLVENHQWVFNPAALILVSSSATEVERTGTQVPEERKEQKRKPKIEEWLNQQLKQQLKDLVVDGDGSSDLGAAVVFNHLSKVREILAKKPEKVNELLANGATALHVSCHNGLPDVIKCLLDNGASVDLPDENGRLPLHIAAGSDRTGEAVLLLTDYGADPNAVTATTCSTSLHFAVLIGHAEAATALVTRGARVNIMDTRGDTPFFYAVRQKKNKMVDILLECSDYDPQFSSVGGYTALHHASRLGNEYVVGKLVERYKDNMDFINFQNKHGSTALLLAAENNKVNVARLLLQTGKCEVNKPKNTGQTPLDEAISNGHRDLADLLRSNRGVGSTSSSQGDINLGERSCNVIEQPRIQPLMGRSIQSVANNKVARKLNEFDAPMDFPEQAASSENSNSDQERNKPYSSKIDEKHVSNLSEKKHISEHALAVTSPRDTTFKQEENQETGTVSVQEETTKNDKSEQGKLAPTTPLFNPSTTGDHDERKTFPSKGQCVKCKTAAATVIFLPCTHKITCEDCSFEEKSCITCGTAIRQKTPESITAAEEVGKTLAVDEDSTTRTLRRQNSATECVICITNERAITFRPCGHFAACSDCAKPLSVCPMCRAAIMEKVTSILS